MINPGPFLLFEPVHNKKKNELFITWQWKFISDVVNKANGICEIWPYYLKRYFHLYSLLMKYVGVLQTDSGNLTTSETKL